MDNNGHGMHMSTAMFNYHLDKKNMTIVVSISVRHFKNVYYLINRHGHEQTNGQMVSTATPNLNFFFYFA